MNGFSQSKDLGNGVRPRAALGLDDPIWRLGALVSLPYSIAKVILVKTPDRSLSLRPCCFTHRSENVSIAPLALIGPKLPTKTEGEATSFPEQLKPQPRQSMK